MTSEQLTALEQLAERRNYGVGPEHPKQVMKLSLRIYRQLAKVGLLEDLENDRLILSAAALLHDMGYPEQPHGEAGFNLLRNEIPRALGADPLSPGDLSAILYCAVWHNGHRFAKISGVEIINKIHVRKLAAILRIADGLDRSLQQLVDSVKLKLEDRWLKFRLKSKYEIEVERERAGQKADLMQEAFELKKITFKSLKIA